jgi:HEPN domain-containing protein
LPPQDYREIAKAYIKEARTDLRAAYLLQQGGEFSRVVANCQQAAEKVVKAALALKGILVLEHQVANRFVTAFPDLPGVREIGRKVMVLELEGTKTRYPLFGRVDLPIWTPSDMYTEDDASTAITDTEFILQELVTFINREYELGL